MIKLPLPQIFTNLKFQRSSNHSKLIIKISPPSHSPSLSSIRSFTHTHINPYHPKNKPLHYTHIRNFIVKPNTPNSLHRGKKNKKVKIKTLTVLIFFHLFAFLPFPRNTCLFLLDHILSWSELFQWILGHYLDHIPANYRQSFRTFFQLVLTHAHTLVHAQVPNWPGICGTRKPENRALLFLISLTWDEP